MRILDKIEKIEKMIAKIKMEKMIAKIAKMEKMIDEFYRIETIIDSCETLKQVQSARNMIETFKHKWGENRFGNVAIVFSMALTKRSLAKKKSFE